MRHNVLCHETQVKSNGVITDCFIAKHARHVGLKKATLNWINCFWRARGCQKKQTKSAHAVHNDCVQTIVHAQEMRREESMRHRVCLIFMPPLHHLCWRTRPTSALGLLDKRRESFTLVPGLLRSAHASWSRVLKSHFFHVRFVVSLEESSRFGVLKKKATKLGWPTSNVKNRRRLCVTLCDPHCTPTPHPHPPTSLDFEHQTRADAVILYRPGRERILSTMGQFIIEKKGEKSWWWCWVDGTERTRVWPQHVALYFIYFFHFYFTWRSPTRKVH